jgi:hypothetical protein
MLYLRHKGVQFRTSYSGYMVVVRDMFLYDFMGLNIFGEILWSNIMFLDIIHVLFLSNTPSCLFLKT